MTTYLEIWGVSIQQQIDSYLHTDVLQKAGSRGIPVTEHEKAIELVCLLATYTKWPCEQVRNYPRLKKGKKKIQNESSISIDITKRSQKGPVW